MPQEPRRIGRPAKAPEPGSRVSLGLKVTGDIKGRLDATARANGRTQSQEAEARLERSFHEEELLPQLLELAYGRQTAGLLLLLGECIRDIAPHASFLSGDHLRPTGDWMERPWPYQQVKAGVDTIFQALAPPGTEEAKAPKTIANLPELAQEPMRHLGQGFAVGVLRTLFGDPKSASDLNRRMTPAREMLVELIKQRRREPDEHR
jgi:hypothetical protein